MDCKDVPLPKNKVNKGKKPSSNLNKTEMPSSSNMEIMNPFQNSGLVNKGNTCYANSILQSLIALPTFLQNLSAFYSNPSPIVGSCIKVLKAISTSKIPVDPSSFLRTLRDIITKSKGVPFKIFEQQDVSEVLEYLLADLSADSVFISDMFETTLKTYITCDICNQDNVTAEAVPFIHLQVMESIQSAINKFCSEEYLSADNARFCHVCNSYNPATLKRQFTKCGSYLIFQLNQFEMTNGITSKNDSFIRIHPQSPFILINVDDEVSLKKSLSLKAVINHSGTLNNGHYTAVTFNSTSQSWINCNDRSVLPATEDMLNGEFPYMLFYEIK